MKIFKTLFLIGSFLIITFSCSAQWSKLPGPTGGSMNNVARVGNEIWAGSDGGIYISTNEGLTWQQSSIADGYVHNLISYNDTVVICYTVVDGFGYKTYSISSFNAGQSFSNPVLLATPTSLADGFLVKTEKALYFSDIFDYYRSLNGGISWTLVTGPGGAYVSDLYSDGELAIASFDIPNPPYLAYYCSVDGVSPWVLLDSSNSIYTIFASNKRIFAQLPSLGYDTLLKTDDFGTTWDTIITGASGYLYFNLNYNNTLYVTGNLDTLASNDNGLTWYPSALPDYRLWRPGVNTTSGNRLFIDKNGEMSTYFPSNNTSLNTNTGIVAHYLTCLYENNNVLFTSGNDHFFKSLDGGNSWILIDSVPATIENMIFRGDTIYALDFSADKFAKSYDNGM
nr:hypothetical protein [Bacteroidia bacterium]